MDGTILPAYYTAIAVYAVVFLGAVKSIEFSQLGTGEKSPTTVNYEVDVGVNKPIHVTNERFLSFALDGRTLNNGWAHFNFREGKARTTVNYEVEVETRKTIHVVDERFLSVGVGLKMLNNGWRQFNFSSAKLQTLTRALAPAYLRLSGRPADFLVFKNPCSSDEETPHGDYVNDPQTYLCPKDWDGINKFCEDTSLKLIFGLNLLLRTKQGGWDPSNAEKLLDYNIHDVAWELGNEPNLFQKIANISLSGTQIGSDFNLFRSVLQSRSRYVGASLFGPDIGGIGRKKTTKMLGSFLAKTNVTNATTFHSYYLNGREATVNDFLDPETLNALPVKIDLVKSLVAEFHGGGSVWLGESGSAFGGGAPNISDRFVAGFLFLDKLGMGAQKGLDVVIRQTYYGGHYTMLDLKNLDPKPDYWSAYIYRRLVGRKVLQVQVTPLPKTNESSQETDSVTEKAFVRVYAHCTATNHSSYYVGAVTLIILNMYKAVSASITLELDEQIIHQYLLTPYGSEGMTASRVELNGQLFQLVNDTVLPKIEPVLIKRGKPIVLPPLSYGFYVLPKAKAKACKIA